MRQVAFFRGERRSTESNPSRMKQRINFADGKRMIAARFATVEPVLGKRWHNKGLVRFMPRGCAKVDGQRKRNCVAHNVREIGHHGYPN